jgi:hypothetical protein
MKSSISKFTALLGISCLTIVLTIIVLIFLSERFTGAGNLSADSQTQSGGATTGNTPLTGTKVYVNALERVRNEYANVKTIEMEADAKIDIIKTRSIVSGTGRIRYAAKDNKYKYACTVSDNLVNEGLMRNIEVLFNGEKFYFYDSESKIVSYQAAEEVRLPAALPNPFFLPIEFLSNDDDNCEGCKMRLVDVSRPIRWAKRVSSISEISREFREGLAYAHIQMPGGDLNKIPYNYRVRLAGESAETMQPISLDRVKQDQIPLAEILLKDMRVTPGINVKIPYNVEVIARDETGRVTLKAVFIITKLKINQAFADTLLAANFADAQSYWNSDERKFDGGEQQ